MANNAFHCIGEPVLTDAEYDIVRDYMELHYPENPALRAVGASIGKNKAILPYEMASMEKIKPDTKALEKWTSKYSGPYVLSCKLDGVSGMYDTEGKKPRLFTRGDGRVGQDISSIIPRLKLPKNKGIVIRGEFLIPKAVFATKYADKFANPRNLVAGIVNQKTHDDRVDDMRFLAYEVIKPAGLKPSEQFAMLQSMNVDVVRNLSVPNLTNESLSNSLQEWRKEYEYEIDGVIVADDNVHPRASGNPEHTFAFKMVLTDQIAEAHVIDVLWSASKDGYLKPRVQITPVRLGGVTIQYATGFNGSFIEENKIGVGAIIQIIRSGDVIPKIQSVITPATKAKMPDVEYVWNDTRVDIVLKDFSNDTTVLEKNLTGFFKGIDVDGLGPKNVAKLIRSGFDSIPKILRMTKDDFMRVDGFQEKTATKLHLGIRDKVDKASLVTIMAVSNKLGRGFGHGKAELIVSEYPTVFVERDLNKLVAIKGIEKETAQSFLEHIPEFLLFLKDCNLESKMIVTKADIVNHALTGKTVVLTGFRDKELEAWLKTIGAKQGTSVSKNTFAVIVKNRDETTGKVEDANRLGVQVMTLDEFNATFTQ